MAAHVQRGHQGRSEGRSGAGAGAGPQPRPVLPRPPARRAHAGGGAAHQDGGAGPGPVMATPGPAGRRAARAQLCSAGSRGSPAPFLRQKGKKTPLFLLT